MPRKPEPKVIEYNPRFSAHGYRHVRWVENVSRGLRFVGFADKIATHIRHTGWYTDDVGAFEKYRGVVYQLPSHGDEKECYVYGYADPNNDDCALLCFEIEGDKDRAARYADQFAERFAEAECDYQRAWQAGDRCKDIAHEVARARSEALKIGEELRLVKQAQINAKISAPTICATLRAKVRELYREIQKLRKERDELRSSYGKEPGFADA
jgi:hypothetical protein